MIDRVLLLPTNLPSSTCLRPPLLCCAALLEICKAVAAAAAAAVERLERSQTFCPMQQTFSSSRPLLPSLALIRRLRTRNGLQPSPPTSNELAPSDLHRIGTSIPACQGPGRARNQEFLVPPWDAFAPSYYDYLPPAILLSCYHQTSHHLSSKTHPSRSFLQTCGCTYSLLLLRSHLLPTRLRPSPHRVTEAVLF